MFSGDRLAALNVFHEAWAFGVASIKTRNGAKG